MRTETQSVTTNTSERLLRRREVQSLTGLPTSTIYNWMSAGLFPRPRKIGPRAVAWREQDVQQWMNNLPEGGHA